MKNLAAVAVFKFWI